MDRKVWHTAVYGVAKSRTWLSNRTKYCSKNKIYLLKIISKLVWNRNFQLIRLKLLQVNTSYNYQDVV